MSRMREAAASMSYGTRQNVISCRAVSNIAKEAAAIPSRGWPTDPNTTSHLRPGNNCTGTSVVGTKTVILPTARHRIKRRPMNMTAKCHARGRRRKAARRIVHGPHIMPIGRIARVGVNIQYIALAIGQWQAFQEITLSRRQASARPNNSGVRVIAHALAEISYRVVMIAPNCFGALTDEPCHDIHRPFGVGAVTDVVTEQNNSLRMPARAAARHASKAGRLAWMSRKRWQSARPQPLQVQTTFEGSLKRGGRAFTGQSHERRSIANRT